MPDALVRLDYDKIHAAVADGMRRYHASGLRWREFIDLEFPPESAEPGLDELVSSEAETEWADLYFIGGAQGPIKIGISVAPAKRLKGLQTGYPYRLRLLAVGEWFERHPDILAEIDRLDTLRRG